MVKYALHPFFRRHQPRVFRGKIDSRFCSQPQHFCVLRNPVDTHPLPHVIEEHVARMHDRVVQIDHSVPSLAVDPALEHDARKKSPIPDKTP